MQRRELELREIIDWRRSKPTMSFLTHGDRIKAAFWTPLIWHGRGESESEGSQLQCWRQRKSNGGAMCQHKGETTTVRDLGISGRQGLGARLQGFRVGHEIEIELIVQWLREIKTFNYRIQNNYNGCFKNNP